MKSSHPDLKPAELGGLWSSLADGENNGVIGAVVDGIKIGRLNDNQQASRYSTQLLQASQRQS